MKAITVVMCVIIFTGFIICLPFLKSNDDGICFAQEQKESKEFIMGFIQKLFDHKYDNPESMTSGRSQIAIDLGFYKDTLAVMPLIKVLGEDSYSDVRESAAYSLGLIGDKRALSSLFNALNDKCVGVQHEAAGALIRLVLENDEKVFITLEKIVRGINQNQWDITNFGYHKDKPEIEQKLKDDLRANAIATLGKIKTEKTKQVIESLTKDSSKTVRESALRILKTIK